MVKVKDVSLIREKWRERGFSCESFQDPPGRQWENLVHKSDELIMPIEGETEIEIKGIIYHPAVGQELYIPKSSVHSIRNVGKTMSLWLFGFNKNPCKRFTKLSSTLRA